MDMSPLLRCTASNLPPHLGSLFLNMLICPHGLHRHLMLVLPQNCFERLSDIPMLSMFGT